MSKTDHVRIMGTHRVGHAPRSWRDMGKGDRIDYGTPRHVKRRLLLFTDSVAISEGLDDLEYLDWWDESWYESDLDDYERDHADALNRLFDEGYDSTKELSHTQSLPSGDWRESGFGHSCNYGCKEYTDGYVYIVHHNSNYGCTF